MLNVEVKITDSGLLAKLEKLQGDVQGTTELNQAMAQGVETTVFEHLMSLNSRSPNTGFYAKAARSTQSRWDAEYGTVTIPHRGTALRLYGGRVNMKDVHLALPTEHVPIRGDERMRPGEMNDLAYLPAGKNAAPGTTGYLLEGILNKSGTRYVPKPEYTDHDPNPEVMPTHEVLENSAGTAARSHLAAAIREGGQA
jgi:hypothetical protein